MHEMFVFLNLDGPSTPASTRRERPDKLTRGTLVMHVPWLEGPPAATPVLLEDAGSGIRQFLLGGMADNAWKLVAALDRQASAPAKKGDSFEVDEDPADLSPASPLTAGQKRPNADGDHEAGTPAKPMQGFGFRPDISGQETTREMIRRLSRARIRMMAINSSGSADSSDSKDSSGRKRSDGSDSDWLASGTAETAGAGLDSSEAVAASFMVTEIMKMAMERMDPGVLARLQEMADADSKAHPASAGCLVQGSASRGRVMTGVPSKAGSAAAVEGPRADPSGEKTASLGSDPGGGADTDTGAGSARGEDPRGDWLTVVAADDADLTDEYSFQTWGRSCMVGMEGEDERVTTAELEKQWDELAKPPPPSRRDKAEAAAAGRARWLATPAPLRRRTIITSLIPGVMQPPVSPEAAADTLAATPTGEATRPAASAAGDASAGTPPGEDVPTGAQAKGDHAVPPAETPGADAMAAGVPLEGPGPEEASGTADKRACGSAECVVM